MWLRATLAVPTAGLLLLAGCSGQPETGTAAGATSSGGTAAGASTSSGSPAPVRCAGNSCSLSFTGDVTSVSVLGTQVTFGGVHDGRATLTVAGRTVSCRQGDSASAGPLRLTCTTVAADRVTVTARLGG